MARISRTTATRFPRSVSSAPPSSNSTLLDADAAPVSGEHMARSTILGITIGLIALFTISLTFAFVSKWHKALMSHEPPPYTSAEAAREARSQKTTVNRWMERVSGGAHPHLQRPPPTPRLSCIALPQPEVAQMGVHVVHFSRARSASLSSSSSSSDVSVEVPPPAYTRSVV